MFSLILLTVLAALFAFLDAWYFIRGITFFLKRLLASTKAKRVLTRDEIFSRSQVHGIVLPSDMDMMWHMNNSKYLREMDFGRFKLFADILYEPLRKLKGRISFSACSIRYRRSLLLWQRFTVETKILCWKDDAIYLEQRFVGSSDKFVYAIALIKFVLRGEGLNNMDIVMETAIGESLTSPPPPPEVEAWMESIAKSSEGLKKERQR